jgi:hypothetical protein
MSKQISIRLPEDIYQLISEKTIFKTRIEHVEQVEQNRSELIIEALKLYLGLSDDFIKRLNDLVELSSIDASILIECVVLGWMARNDANHEVYGGTRQQEEFVVTQAGFAKGDNLFNYLYQKYIQEFRCDKDS